MNTDTELLDWIAEHFHVVLANPGDVRLEKIHPNERRADDRQRFRAALGKIIRDYGLT